MSQRNTMVGEQMNPPESVLPRFLTPKLDPSDHFEHDDQKHIHSGFESGPSRPPTPHGPGFPPNFAEVVDGIYRSSFPMPDHIESIKKLNLKTIVTLVETEYSWQLERFIRDNKITSYIIPILPNKDPNISTPQGVVVDVLNIILNPENHPVLVHCNKGKHRTGCVMACFREAQGWSSGAAIAEYVKYSTPKSRILDQKYIEAFDTSGLSETVARVGAQYWVAKTTNQQQSSGNTCNRVNGKTKEAENMLRGSPIALPPDTEPIRNLAVA